VLHLADPSGHLLHAAHAGVQLKLSLARSIGQTQRSAALR
jgi:hypothetical protein